MQEEFLGILDVDDRRSKAERVMGYYRKRAVLELITVFGMFLMVFGLLMLQFFLLMKGSFNIHFEEIISILLFGTNMLFAQYIGARYCVHAWRANKHFWRKGTIDNVDQFLADKEQQWSLLSKIPHVFIFFMFNIFIISFL